MKKKGYAIILFLVILAAMLAYGAVVEIASVSSVPVNDTTTFSRYTIGEQRVGVFLIDYINDGQEQAKEQIADAIFRSTWSINNFVKESSYNKAWLTGDVFGWVHLAEEERYCWPDDGTLLENFQNAGVNFSKYSRYVLLIRGKKTGCAFGVSSFGKIALRTPDGLVNASLSRIRAVTFHSPSDVSRTTNAVLAHELLHAFGIPGHANAYDCGNRTLTANASACVQVPEGDPFDIMGRRYWSSQPNACFKEELGWIAPEEIKTIQKSGTYTLFPLESSSSKTKALKIRLKNPIPLATATGNAINMTAYYVEYRVGQGVDNRLLGLAQGRFLAPQPINTTGVLIRGAFFNERKCTTTYLLDMHPESFPDENGAASNDGIDSFLYVGESFRDPHNKITITPIDISPEGEVKLKIKFP